MAHVYTNYCNQINQKNCNSANIVVDDNLMYKKKYKKFKKLIKNTVFENAALCDQVAQMQENLVMAKEERLFLLRKLLQLQGELNDSSATALSSSSSAVASTAAAAASSSSASSNKVQLNHNLQINADGPVTNKRSTKKRNSVDNMNVNETNTKGKSKRTNKAARRVVQLIPLDMHGRPLFPISLGDLTVYSLGEVVSDRVGYHTEDVIYPVGFCSTRLYASLKDVNTQSLYTCKILDGGPKPRFEIVSDTDLDHPLVGSSPDECHLRLLSAISPILSNIMPRGANFFGISHPTIQNLIQSSSGTRKLVYYKQQKFEVSKNVTNENGMNPSADDDSDPSINFTALHRAFALNTNYTIKQEPGEHDFSGVQNLT